MAIYVIASGRGGSMVPVEYWTTADAARRAVKKWANDPARSDALISMSGLSAHDNTDMIRVYRIEEGLL